MQSALLRRKIAAAAVSAPPIERAREALPTALADLFGAQWKLHEISARAIAAADAAGAIGPRNRRRSGRSWCAR